MAGRTFVVGDVHGDLAGLEAVLDKLPPLDEKDTLLFLGDYVDRGPNPRGVVTLVRELQQSGPAEVITLRGNHEDKWIRSWEAADVPYLVQIVNGCGATYRSFISGPPLLPDEGLPMDELPKMLEVRAWMPEDVIAWMRTLDLWYEDAHAIYVHAGLEGEGETWKHPRDSAEKPLLWGRQPDFYAKYKGKRVVFGHTPVKELPGHEDNVEPWVTDDLAGIDTGAGKGGFLTVLELPALKLYDSREAK